MAPNPIWCTLLVAGIFLQTLVSNAELEVQFNEPRSIIDTLPKRELKGQSFQLVTLSEIWEGALPLNLPASTVQTGATIDDMALVQLRNFTISEEKRLIQYLLWRYEVAGIGGRPVIHTYNSTRVELGLGLIQLDLDERNKVLSTSMWTRLKWLDLYLKWNPADFGGVHAMRLESNQLWIPDIMLYNTAEPENEARNALVIVLYDGTVQWVPHQIFKSSCSIDATNFPFDTQVCHMWFGSWTHPMSDIDLNLAGPGGIDLSTFQSDYKDSCEWDIIEQQAERKLLPENDTNPIAVLSFTLRLQRKLVFSSYILTLPCIFLASLTLVVFWLPPERPDRTALAMNLFASFLVLLLILVEAAPPTASSVPMLGVYYCYNMVIIMLSIFLSTLVVNIHRAGENKRPVPYWIDVIILKGLGRLLCKCSVSNQPPARNYSRVPSAKPGEDEQDKHWNLVRGTENRTFSRHKFNSIDSNNISSTTTTEGSYANYSMVLGEVEEIKKLLREMVANTKCKDEADARVRAVNYEWREVANTLDRFFFCLYIAVNVVGLLLFFPRPHTVI